ncbi:hypothetical protein, partial [uncultured Dubosiella sp.]|uniref:hypothetical protein n=1 Tax=uncultured Dubosiella sp. TaxID=1937011 RepID=UPI00259B1EA2
IISLFRFISRQNSSQNLQTLKRIAFLSRLFSSLFFKKKSQNEWFGKKMEPWFSGKMKQMIYFFVPMTNSVKKTQSIIKKV